MMGTSLRKNLLFCSFLSRHADKQLHGHNFTFQASPPNPQTILKTGTCNSERVATLYRVGRDQKHVFKRDSRAFSNVIFKQQENSFHYIGV